MGCNYYATPKITSELKNKLVEAVESENFILLKKLIPEKIHIGKSSGGWQFCFNHNDWYYFERTKLSLYQFLLNCDIYDEYDVFISNEDFWNMVSIKGNGKAHLEWNNHICGLIEFGLNFSTSTNFS